MASTRMSQVGFDALSEEVSKAAEEHPDDIEKQIEIALACPCVGMWVLCYGYCTSFGL